EVAVEKPQVGSVANHELTGAAAAAGVIAGGRVLRMDLPAELPRARHDERAGGAVDFAAVRINERLQEARPQRPETIEIPVERRGGCLRRRDTHQCHSTGASAKILAAAPQGLFCGRSCARQSLTPPAARAPAHRARHWSAAG